MVWIRGIITFISARGSTLKVTGSNSRVRLSEFFNALTYFITTIIVSTLQQYIGLVRY